MRASTWALASLMLVSGCDDAADEALDPPAGFSAVPGDGSVALSWKNPDGAEVAIVRVPNASPAMPPEDERLVAGRTFEPGVVVLYVGTGESFTDRTMERCDVLAYHAYTQGAGLERSIPAEVSQLALPMVEPGEPPSTLAATVVDGGVRLTWDAPANPKDLVSVSRSDGVETIPITTKGGAGLHVDRQGLVAAETYRYSARTCTPCGVCSGRGPEVAVSIPVDFAPSDLTVDPTGATVDFAWSAARGSMATMRLLAREGEPVAGPSDAAAEVLYEGADAEAHVAMTTFLPDVFEEETRYHFAVFACVGDDCSEGATADYAFSLGDALRGGGHVVYFEHGEAGVCVDRTDLGTADETTTPDWWTSCVRSCDVATAEQLSAEGYEGAEAAGRALRDAGVPFDEALSSEYCRAVETLERLEVVPASSIETRAELTPFVYGDEPTRCEATLLLLGGAALSAPDRNAVIVGHPGLPEACGLIEALAPGEAAVVRPSGRGPVVLARVAPDDWQGAL